MQLVQLLLGVEGIIYWVSVRPPQADLVKWGKRLRELTSCTVLLVLEDVKDPQCIYNSGPEEQNTRTIIMPIPSPASLAIPFVLDEEAEHDLLEGPRQAISDP